MGDESPAGILDNANGQSVADREAFIDSILTQVTGRLKNPTFIQEETEQHRMLPPLKRSVTTAAGRTYPVEVSIDLSYVPKDTGPHTYFTEPTVNIELYIARPPYSVVLDEEEGITVICTAAPLVKEAAKRIKDAFTDAGMKEQSELPSVAQGNFFIAETEGPPKEEQDYVGSFIFNAGDLKKAIQAIEGAIGKGNVREI